MATLEEAPVGRRFPSPFEVETPPGAEGWQRMYPYYTLFSEENREGMERVIGELKAIEIPSLSRLDDELVVTEGRGVSSGYNLLVAYDRIVENLFLAWQHHFEMLNLGYAAYLNLFQFCKQAFPGMKDETIAQMVAGSDLLFFKPDDELKKLAQLALDLGIGERLRAGGRAEDIVEALKSDENGRQWVEALEAIKDPWFYFSNGAGFYHHLR